MLKGKDVAILTSAVSLGKKERQMLRLGQAVLVLNFQTFPTKKQFKDFSFKKSNSARSYLLLGTFKME